MNTTDTMKAKQDQLEDAISEAIECAVELRDAIEAYRIAILYVGVARIECDKAEEQRETTQEQAK